MEIKQEVSEDQIATVTIEIPAEEVSGRYTTTLQEFQKTANIPGFRPGKIPLRVIRNRYGKAIFQELAEDQARDYLPKAMEQVSLQPGGMINIDLLEYGEDKSLKFQVVFPLRPEVKLKKYKGLEVTVDQTEVTDEDIDNQIEGLRRKHAISRSVDTPSTAEAILKLRVQEVDPSGMTLIGRKSEDRDFEFGMDQLSRGTDEQLIGIRAGEKRIIRTFKDAPDSGQLIVTPGQSNEWDAEGDSLVHLAVEALKVEIPELPEVDDNLAQKIDEDVSTMDELKQKFKDHLQVFTFNILRSRLKESLIAKLIQENPFPISKAVLRSNLTELVEKTNPTGEGKSQFIQEHLGEAEKNMRWLMLKNKIANEENLTVTDEYLEQEYEIMARMEDKPVEDIRKRFADDDARDSLMMNILEDKVVKLLAHNAIIDGRELSFNDFLRSLD